MISVLGIVIQNFRSWQGKHYVPLKDLGLVAVMGVNHDAPVLSPSNGAGKTGIGAALRWCLYGASDTQADAVINEIAGKDTTVITRLIDDDGRLIVVERYRARPKTKPASSLIVTVNGVADGYTTLDVGETQKKLNELLGMDATIFEAAVMFHQAPGARTAFVDLGDADAKAVLSNILPIGGIDDMKAANDSELALCKNGIATLSGQLAGLQSNVEQLKHYIVDADTRGAAWAADQEARIAWVRNELQTIETEGIAVRGQLDAMPAQQQLITIPSTHNESRALQQTQQAVRHIEERIGQYRRQLQHLQSPQAAFCPTCAQPVATNASPAEQIEQTMAAIDGLERRDLQPARVAAEAAAHALQVAEQRVVEARAAQMAVAPTEQLRSQLASRRQQLQQAWTTTNHRLGAEIAAVNPFVDAGARARAQIDGVIANVRVLEGRLGETTERASLLEWWSAGLGRQGLKSFVLDSYLEIMTTEANRWVSIITGGRGWVRFETQKAAVSGKKLIEQINVRCFTQGPSGETIERSIRDAEWSGGERQRYALAIDFGLARLVAGRAKRAWDTLILDEVFRYLDAGGKQAFVDVLRQLAKDKSTVLLVDHDPTFTAYCDSVIVVEKRNGCSSIQQPTEETAA